MADFYPNISKTLKMISFNITILNRKSETQFSQFDFTANCKFKQM